MKIIANALRRLLDWLGEQEPSREHTLSPRDWFDLPTHHPACDTCH